MTDSSDPAHGANMLYDPPTYPAELTRFPLDVNEVLRTDKVPAHDVMLDDPQIRIGTANVDASRYFSPEFFELERKKLWPKVWQMACWGQDIPNPGDIHVYRILDRSVLITRQRDGTVKGFINACLHRGRELCDEHTHQAEFKCPYHFFTWGLDGDAKWIASKWDFPQIDEAKFSLPQVRLEEWNGFIFINFDPDAPSLADYMGKRFIDHWKHWDFSGRYKAIHVRKELNCNWKAGLDAFIEGFHAFASHNQGVATNCEDCSQIDIWPDSPHMSRFTIPMGFASHRLDPRPGEQEVFDILAGGFLPEAKGTDELTIKPGEDIRSALDRVVRKSYKQYFGIDTDVPTTELYDAIEYFLFPNILPWPSLAWPLFYRFLPGKDADSCIWDIMVFLPYSGERPPSCETIHCGPDDPLVELECFSGFNQNSKSFGGLALILHQDAVQLPLVQSGMKNLPNGELIISEYQEMRIRHYHQVITDYISR